MRRRQSLIEYIGYGEEGIRINKQDSNQNPIQLDAYLKNCYI